MRRECLTIKKIYISLIVHDYIRDFIFRLGNYRMPFAWAARPLFRLYSNELDTSSDFPAIYRQEGNKIKDEELLKLLSEYRKYVLIIN